MSFISLSPQRRRRVASVRAEGKRRWRLFAVLGVSAVAVAGGIGVAAATTNRTTAAPGVVSCPTVADRLPAAPAAARAEVDRNLALLETQIREANARLVSSVGQGGPNFVRNAILGPLQSKRVATLDRIRIAYNRQGVTVSGLDALASCTVADTGGEGAAEPPAAEPPAAEPPAAEPPAAGDPADPAAPPAAPPANAAPGTISCPSVADRLPPAPAAAQAEVDRNLAQLETQIWEANARLASSVGQGGPNFVRNAILGPLADKRRAALDRIRLAYDRQGATVSGLDALANCSVA